MAFVNEYAFTMEQMSSPIRYHPSETFGEQIEGAVCQTAGQYRLANLIGCAVRVIRMADGSESEVLSCHPARCVVVKRARESDQKRYMRNNEKTSPNKRR